MRFSFPSPSRSSAPSEAFVLWPSVLRATIPLRPRFVPLCGLRSINASPRCRPRRLLASLRWLHIVFVPPAAQGLLLPFAATVAHRRCHRKRTPSASTKVRDLTTTFRSVGQTTLPYLQRRHDMAACICLTLKKVDTIVNKNGENQKETEEIQSRRKNGDGEASLSRRRKSK